MSGIVIERATAQQSADALALIEEYYEVINVVARDSREALLSYLAGPHSAIWVAHVSSIPAGCILYRPLDLSTGEVKRLYVRPAYRGLGIASLLLRALEQFAAAQHVSYLYLDSKDDLHDAIAFYQRHGYTPCDRYNDNPQATIFMRKSLPHRSVCDPAN